MNSGVLLSNRMVVYIRTFLLILFAVGILLISIFRSAVPNYAFSQPMNIASDDYFTSSVDYYFPTPGINPEHPLWPAKVARDKLQLFANIDPEKRLDLLILYSDKRLIMSRDLMKSGKSELAVSTASKAEKYLQEAFFEVDNISQNGEDPTSSLFKLSKASLKHREVLEEMRSAAPDDAKPVINVIMNITRDVYESSAKKLKDLNRPVPSPFPRVN